MATVNELKTRAEELHIEGFSNMLKADLEKAIAYAEERIDAGNQTDATIEDDTNNASVEVVETSENTDDVSEANGDDTVCDGSDEDAEVGSEESGDGLSDSVAPETIAGAVNSVDDAGEYVVPNCPIRLQDKCDVTTCPGLEACEYIAKEFSDCHLSGADILNRCVDCPWPPDGCVGTVDCDEFPEYTGTKPSIPDESTPGTCGACTRFVSETCNRYQARVDPEGTCHRQQDRQTVVGNQQ